MESPMIENTITRNIQRDKRIEHRSALSTFTNLVADGTNCSVFEAQVISTTAEEVFGLGEQSEDGKLQPGQMVWRAIDASEPPGKPLSRCVYHRVRLTVHHLEEDSEVRKNHGLSAKRQQQILRMCTESLDQGTLLTQEDLSIILDCDVKTIRTDIRRIRETMDVLVPTRGTKLDIGPGITHREKAVEMFIRGRDAVGIARDLTHSLKAVERYITSFCRIIHVQKQVHNSLRTALITGFSVALVDRNLALRDKWMKTPDYRDRLERIQELGLRYWNAGDSKKGGSLTNGRQK
jgi:DNA-binding CsgD family transcriptional regulator